MLLRLGVQAKLNFVTAKPSAACSEYSLIGSPVQLCCLFDCWYSGLGLTQRRISGISDVRVVPLLL